MDLELGIRCEVTPFLAETKDTQNMKDTKETQGTQNTQDTQGTQDTQDIQDTKSTIADILSSPKSIIISTIYLTGYISLIGREGGFTTQFLHFGPGTNSDNTTSFIGIQLDTWEKVTCNTEFKNPLTSFGGLKFLILHVISENTKFKNWRS